MRKILQTGVIGLVVMVAGCGGGSAVGVATIDVPVGAGGFTEEQTRAVMEGHLEEALSVLPPGTSLVEHGSASPALDCDASAIERGGPMFASVVTIAEGLPAGQELRAVHIIAEHWLTLGWTLTTDYRSASPDRPYVGATSADGYAFGLSTSEHVGLIVKGSTPCFPADTELVDAQPMTVRRR